MGTYRNPLTEYTPETESFAFEQQFGEGGSGIFSESQEMELASRLLEVNNEQELEQFLGDLIKGVGNAIGGIVKSPIGRAIGGVLKGAARVALPIGGGALGTFVGGPVGSMIGSNLGSMAGQALGLELEGLSPEDREFETARQFVRFAGDTVKNALEIASNADPLNAANAAARQAAADHAPGLVNMFRPHKHRHHPHHREGYWVRHSDKIVLHGV